MRIFLLILFTICSFADTKGIQIKQNYLTTDIYQEGVTYNIVSFVFDDVSSSENIFEASAPVEQNEKLGIVTSGNILVDLIWEYQSLSNDIQGDIIQTVELKDLNNDDRMDLIINYMDTDSDFPDQIISSFLLNNNNKFQEISETFVKNRYQFLDNSHIIYETPLALFGRPYVDEDSAKETQYWVDHYEFQGLKLINVNQKYRDFYESFKVKSSKELESTLNKVRLYSMSEEATINQLQLEEYFNEITELKTIIFRSNQILY